MNNKIKADLYRHDGLVGTKGFLKGLRIPGFMYMYLFRKASSYKKRSLGWIWFNFWLKRYGYKYGFQIPSFTDIGEGFYIGHFGTIVVNPKAKIGKNCNIAHGVTIGQANRGKYKGFPTIGDKVWIGTNAVVVGSITIGSNVLIAANAFVNVDVPSGSVVIGNPCQVIPNSDPVRDYINFTVE